MITTILLLNILFIRFWIGFGLGFGFGFGFESLASKESVSVSLTNPSLVSDLDSVLLDLCGFGQL